MIQKYTKTYLNKILQMQSFSSYKQFTQQWKLQSSYYSAIQWATGLQFYYVIADPKVAE